MCGIVGLFIKNPEMEQQLGEHLSNMLLEMTERGPDSAGVAIYHDSVADGSTKITLLSHGRNYAWGKFEHDISAAFGGGTRTEVRADHAVVVVPAAATDVHAWLHQHYPDLHLTSSGNTIETFKQKGLPADLIDRFQLRQLRGTHALGHTRMATESAVTTEHSHPFSTGLDLCLVHNGSLSNHNRLRESLRKHGVEFQTDNDSEVAAGYLMWRMREGATLDEALQAAISDLDGFYTFAVGTRDGFAVLRDPVGCKPAVMAETNDWVAMASEFRAIATLPGADDARIWEPEPEKIYSWQRA